MSDKASPTSTDLLVITRVFDATPERIFAAWAEPTRLAQWWGPPGKRVTVLKLDFHVGGEYRFRIQHPKAEPFLLRGIYHVIQPPRKLVFTWRWENPEMDIGESLVSIELRASGPQTELQLTHARLPSAAARQAHGEGWDGILGKLQLFLHDAAAGLPLGS